MTDARHWLDEIANNPLATPEHRTALALTGILAAIVERDDSEGREDALIELHDRADAALGRVLKLADILDANPNATLKPTAFRDLAVKIRTAVDGGAA